MSMAMRTIIGDLSADNARGPGGFGAGVYWGVGVQHSHKRPPINSFSSNLFFFLLHLFHFIFIFFL